VRTREEVLQSLITFPSYVSDNKMRLVYSLLDLRCSVFVSVGRVFALNFEKQNKRNESVANCGVALDCGVGAFPVRLYSGFENRELPKICINGH
jgi:hypothetical protein